MQSMPGESRALDAAGVLSHAIKGLQFREVDILWRCNVSQLSGKSPGNRVKTNVGVGDRQIRDRFGEQRGRGHRYGTPGALETDVGYPIARVDTQVQAQFVATQRVDSLGRMRGVIQASEITWFASVVEYQFPVQVL